MYQFLGAVGDPNPTYQDELETFWAAFAIYFTKSWVQRHRTVEIAPVVHCRNGVQAKDVSVRLFLKTRAKIVSHTGAEEKPPAKPRRTIARRAFPFASSLDISAIRRLSILIRSVHAIADIDSFAPTINELASDEFEIRYRLLRLAQEDSIALNPFYLLFENEIEPGTCKFNLRFAPKTLRLSSVDVLL